MSKQHPAWESILEWVESPDGFHEIGEHVAHCPSCRKIASSQRRLLAAFAALNENEPPKALVQASLRAVMNEPMESTALTELLARLGARLGKELREIRAALTADSLLPSPVLRGGGSGRRSLLFETEDYRISLGLAGARDRSSPIRGQVSPKRASTLPAGGKAVLCIEQESSECALSEFGEFVLPASQQSRAELAILIEDQVIRMSIPEVSSGEES